MSERTKQLVLTLALGMPLVITALVAGPFTASTTAQGGARMLGPRFPPLVDTNGDGQPTPGADSPVNPRLQGSTLGLTTLFSCGSQQNNTVGLFGQDSSGKFRRASRTNNFRGQDIGITGFSGGGASQFAYTETDTRGTRAAGNGSLFDLNGDGKMDTLFITGNINTTISLVFSADGNYVGIPVSQQQLLGGTQGRCGPAVSQFWFPLADTDGDGRGDTIIFDLDGDGIADPQFYSSPKLGAAAVPTANNLSLSLLTVLLGGAGVWYLGRRQQGASGPTVQS